MNLKVMLKSIMLLSGSVLTSILLTMARTGEGKGKCPKCGKHKNLHSCNKCEYALCKECWDEVYNTCPKCGHHH
jgi:uncharacterized paraquat-inducible protein A